MELRRFVFSWNTNKTHTWLKLLNWSSAGAGIMLLTTTVASAAGHTVPWRGVPRRSGNGASTNPMVSMLKPSTTC